MNLKKLIVFLVFGALFIPINFAFAEDLKIEEGKNLKFYFKGDNIWYDDTKVYDKVNVGAGTKVFFDSEWQYVFVSSVTSTSIVPRKQEEGEPIIYDEIHITTYTYRKDEIIATLSIKKDGELILNSGSELSIRNQYDLITSTQDVSFGYGKDEGNNIVVKDVCASNIDDVFTYVSEHESYTKIYNNRNLKDDEIDLFTGKITFGSGSLDTMLTFRDFSTKETTPLPSPSSDKIIGHTASGGDIIDRDYILDSSVTISSTTKSNDIFMCNDFQINSNRAVFNIIDNNQKESSSQKEWAEIFETGRHITLGNLGGSYLFGNGTIVKKGRGTMILSYDVDEDGSFVSGVIGNGLTGLNTGYAWNIEEGTLIAYKRDNLGTAGILISSTSNLGLDVYSAENRFSSTTVILDTETYKKFNLNTNCFSNNITTSSGTIIISSGSQIELSGNINTIDKDYANFKFYKNSVLVLSGDNNNAKNFNINFGSKNGGESNYLITDVDGLASGSIKVTNTTPSDLKDYAFFELVLKEDEDKEYGGSLIGDMYLRKLGFGSVTLSGEKNEIKGLYLSEGDIVIKNSMFNADIRFDGGVRGDSTTYSSISISSNAYTNDYKGKSIYIKNGAILDIEGSIEGDETFYIQNIESYGEDNKTEIIKTGNGVLSTYHLNVSSVNIRDGGFVLVSSSSVDPNNSNTYFSLDGQNAYLKFNNDTKVNNVIDVYSGELIILNEANISSATIKFYDESISTDSFSKFHTIKNTYISTETVSNKIDIAKNIEFVIDGKTTVNLDSFIFNAGEETTIVKSGTGTFIAENNNRDFDISGLYISSGSFQLKDINNFSMDTLYIDKTSSFNFDETNNFSVNTLHNSGAFRVTRTISGFNVADTLYNSGSFIFGEYKTNNNFSVNALHNSGTFIINRATDTVSVANTLYNSGNVTFREINNFSANNLYIDSGTFTVNNATGTFIVADTLYNTGKFSLGETSIFSVDTLHIDRGTFTVSKATDTFSVNNLYIDSGKFSLGETSDFSVNNLYIDSGTFIINKATSSFIVTDTLHMDSGTFNLGETSVFSADTIHIDSGTFIVSKATDTFSVNNLYVSGKFVLNERKGEIDELVDTFIYETDNFNVDNLCVDSGTFFVDNVDNFNVNSLSFNGDIFTVNHTNNFNVNSLYVNNGSFRVHDTLNNRTTFNVDNVSINGGTLDIDETSMKVTNPVIIDGGFLSINDRASLTITGEDKTINISSGGIGVYSGWGIDDSIELRFNGEDKENLSRLSISSLITNDIYVKTGVIVENIRDINFSDLSINFENSKDNVLAKAGGGKMTLSFTEPFEIGELRILGGTLFVDSVINVSTVTVQGGTLSLEKDNLTSADNIFLQGNLSLSSPGIVLDPSTVISEIASDEGLETNRFSNNINSSGGTVAVSSGSQVELTGNLYSDNENKNLKFSFNKRSAIVLSGNNENIESFNINATGEANYLVTNVDMLPSKSIVSTATDDFSFVELVLKETEDKKYSGLLQGKMYLHKLGSGVLTLLNENNFMKGIYITEGDLVIKSSDVMSTGNICFDGGVRGDSTTYSSLLVFKSNSEYNSTENSSLYVSTGIKGYIEMPDNIYIKNGAILNVLEKQTLNIFGDIVSYEESPGYDTEFIKIGLGEIRISSRAFEENRQINISSFNIKEGGFVLNEKMVLDSYFSLDGQKAYLKMNKGAGIKNNVIDIYSGNLTIFDQNNISSVTAINFYNEETSTDSFSKFHTTNDTYISTKTISGTINVAKNIEFVTDKTTVVNLNKFIFNAVEETVIVKSGMGTFTVENNNMDFDINSLYVNGGKLKLEDIKNFNVDALHIGSGTFTVDKTIDSFSVNNLLHIGSGTFSLGETSNFTANTLYMDSGTFNLGETSNFTANTLYIGSGTFTVDKTIDSFSVNNLHIDSGTFSLGETSNFSANTLYTGRRGTFTVDKTINSFSVDALHIGSGTFNLGEISNFTANTLYMDSGTFTVDKTIDSFGVDTLHIGSGTFNLGEINNFTANTLYMDSGTFSLGETSNFSVDTLHITDSGTFTVDKAIDSFSVNNLLYIDSGTFSLGETSNFSANTLHITDSGTFTVDKTIDSFSVNNLHIDSGTFSLGETSNFSANTLYMYSGTFSLENTENFDVDDMYLNSVTFNLDNTENIDIDNIYINNGNFTLDNADSFNVGSIYLNDGNIRLDNTNMNVSGTTVIDGGELYISSTSKFTSIGEDKKITVLRGNIHLYDDNSIDSETELRFEGIGEKALPKLIFETKENINLKNDMYVRTGIIIENENNLRFSGSINYDLLTPGILEKLGEGTMIIDSLDVFKMGEIRTLEGNLLVKSDIDVSNIFVVGEEAKLTFDNVSNANVKEFFYMNSGGTLSISTSTVNIANLDLYSSNIIINGSSELNSNIINFNDSIIELHSDLSAIKATSINLTNKSYVKGCGNLNATVNVKDGSSIYIGSVGNTGEIIKANNVIFESNSNLYIDVSSVDGVTTTDKLEVTDNITVSELVNLHVNLMGEESEYDTQKDFEFITFSGSSNLTDKIFNIILSNPRFSADTALMNKSIVLQISQQWSVYDIPGATKNQEAMINVFNEIYADAAARNSMAFVLSTLDIIYSNYRITGDKTEFVDALQDLSGIFYANSFMTSAMLSKSNIIYNRLNNYSKEREEENRLWTHVYTNNFSVAENDENPKFENSIYGMIAGYDTIYDEDVILGFTGFYGTGELKELQDKADIQDIGANVYADYKINEKINIKGIAGYSLQNYDMTRVVKCMGDEKIKSKFVNNTVNLDLEASYQFELNEKLSLKPIIGGNYTLVSNEDIEEEGDSSCRLKINRGSYSKADVKVGIGLQNKMEAPFNWHISAAVKQIVTGDKFTTKSSFIKSPEYEFEIESTKLASTSLAGSLGCSYDISSNFNVSLDLNADTGSASQFGANIGVIYKW